MKKVLATFEMEEDMFEVEYQDTSGEWIGAAGEWKYPDIDDKYLVRSEYDTPDAAKKVAQDLRGIFNKSFRVVYV